MEKAIYLVLNEEIKSLENWRILNTVFMLGTVLGNKLDHLAFGPAITDGSGVTHAGIGNIVLPVLSMKENEMLTFYKLCKERERTGGFEVIDFTLTAQNSHKYEEYFQKLSAEKLEEQLILGIALLGEFKTVRSLCGSLARWK